MVIIIKNKEHSSLYYFLPFLVLVSFCIFQDSFALESYRGYDYLDVTNPDGTHTWTGGLPPYILDSDDNYVPFLYPSVNHVETNHGSVILNPDGSYSFYKKGIIDSQPLFSDRIIAKYADISDLNSWTYLNVLNNDTPDNSWDGNQFVSTKLQLGVGKLEYKYILSNGVWKTQLEPTNLSSLTTKVFGMDQIVDLNRDTIIFAGIERNLDNFDGIVFDREWLVSNEAKVIDFLNDISFDFDLGFDNLYSVTVYDTGVNSSQLVFDYRTSEPLLPNETLVIDPVYSSNNPTIDAYLVDSNDNGVCSTFSTATESATTLLVGTFASGAISDCARSYIEWDTTSISDTATITNVVFKSDVNGVGTSPENCDITPLISQPSITSDATIFADIADGTPYVDNSNFCVSIGTNKNIDLGASADTDVQSLLSVNWFAIGLKGNDETQTINADWISIVSEEGTGTPDPTLEITYTLPVPSAPLNPILNNMGTHTATASWDTPTDCDNCTGYRVYINDAIYNNDTGTTDTSLPITGIDSGTLQELIVHAWNATGAGTNSSAVENYTLNTAPTLDKVNVYNTTAFELFYTINGTFNGIKINIDEFPYSTFSTLIANSTSSAVSLIVNGFTEAVDTSVKIFAHNLGGTSVESNQIINATALTSAPVLVSVSPTSLVSTLDLVFTAPVNGTATTYSIERSPSGCASMSIVDTGITTTSYTATGLVVNTNYCFEVTSVNAYGNSTASNQVSGTTASSNSPGGGGGSGGGSSNPVSSIASGLLLNLNSKSFSLSLGEKRTYALDLIWDETKEFSLFVKSITITATGLNSLSIQPEVLPADGKRITNGKGEVLFNIDVPSDRCDNIQQTARCVYVKTYIIPVKVTVSDILGVVYSDIPATLTIIITDKFPVGLVIIGSLLLASIYPMYEIMKRSTRKDKRPKPKDIEKNHKKALKQMHKNDMKRVKHNNNIFKKLKSL